MLITAFRPHNKNSGFTIIEVLIVLAIAGLIMAIVFLAVPAITRAQRNYGRKSYATYVAGILEEYRSINGHYPYDGSISGTTDGRCAFIESSLQGGVTCTDDTTKQCIYSNLKKYDICYRKRTVGGHDYFSPEDEMVIVFGHVCNVPPHVDPDPAHVTWPYTGINNHNVTSYAVYTQLEQGPFFCVDSGT